MAKTILQITSIITNPAFTDYLESQVTGSTATSKVSQQNVFNLYQNNMQLTPEQINGTALTLLSTTDDLSQGTDNFYLTNDGGSTDNLTGLPTITDIYSQISSKINRSGDTMTGYLTANADPVANLQYATKQYTDNSINLVGMQEVYDNSISKQIVFDTGSGIDFKNSSNSNVFIIDEVAVSSFVPLIVSADGISGFTALLTNDPSAIVQTQSTTQGAFPVPRMTTAQMNSITTTYSLGISQAGLEVYVTDLVDGKYYWDGTDWLYVSNNGSSGNSLQAAYAVGNTISLSSSRPFSLSTEGTTGNFIYLFSPGGPPSNYNYDSLEGIRFTPVDDVFVIALQYVDIYFPSGSRQVAIYRISDQALMISDLVYKTDPLDGTGHYRSHAVTPVLLQAGIPYIVIGIVPANENWTFYAISSPPEFNYTGITFGQAASAPVFPTTISNTMNAIYGNQNFEYSLAGSSVSINDPTDNSLLKVVSTVQGASPFPAMTQTQGNALSTTGVSPGFGYFNSTSKSLTLWDGSSWNPIVNSAGLQTISGTKTFVAPMYIEDGSSNPLYSFALTNADFELPLRVALNSDVDLIFMGNTNQPLCSIFEVFSSNFGSIPFPLVSLTTRNSWPVDSDSWGLGAFITDTQTIDYYTGAVWTSLVNTTAGQTIGGTKTFTSPIIAALTGNSSTATALQTARAINGVNFDGSAPITVTAAAGTLTGTTLNSTVVTSSLTSVGTIATGTWSGSFGAVSGANLTSLTAANISAGTAPINISGNSATVTTNANLTGDVSSTGNSTVLATVNSNVGSFGGATQTGTFTVNAKGLLTAASNVTISGVAPGGSSGGDLSGTYPNPTVAKINTVALGSTTATSGNLLIASGTQWVTNAMSGNVTINSTGVTTIGAAQVTNAMLAGSIDLTAKVTGTLPFAQGGLGFATATTGDLFYASATNTPNKLADVATGQVLTSGGVGVAPAWSASPTLTQLNLPNGQALVLGTTLANQLTISSSTGTSNRADIALNRFDFTQGNCRFFFQTGGTNEWSNGMRGGSGDYQIFDEVNAVTQLRMTQGSGITGVSTFAGSIVINSTTTALTFQNAAAISAKNSSGTSEIFMYPRFGDNKTYMDIGSAGATFRQDAAGATWMSVDSSSNVTFATGNVLIGTAASGITQKSVAVSGGTANGSFNTGVVLVAGTVTISNSYVTANCTAQIAVSTTGGTPSLFGYRIVVGSGTYTITGAALDTSTLNVYFTKGN